MFRTKLFTVLTLVLFILGIATINNAVAGEKQKFKSHGASYTTASNQIEVGDEEGHVLVIYENRSIYFNEISGERSADRGVGFMDINPNKPGEIFLQGYGVYTDKDGDKMIRTVKGKPVAKGQWKGTWTIKNGTGKYEGAKGGGTWTSYSLAPKQSYVEVEGEMETP